MRSRISCRNPTKSGAVKSNYEPKYFDTDSPLSTPPALEPIGNICYDIFPRQTPFIPTM